MLRIVRRPVGMRARVIIVWHSITAVVTRIPVAYSLQPLLGGSQFVNETECRYTEFRNAPTDDHPYKRPMIYWKILTGRLAFIVIYQNIINMLQGVLRWAVPDVSGRLLKRIKRENFLLREHIIEYEKQHAMLQAQTAVHIQQTKSQESSGMRQRHGAGDEDATSFV
ncbi:GL20403 [Drosophila persimilis]|uniref:GL20403 n=1 Tax=Drosophila persimilis TaxID=7234 RepID=B4GY30_DROPE|nr:GL20403 [Drosophila persimilis]